MLVVLGHEQAGLLEGVEEGLIAGGPVVNAVRTRGGGEIVPVDSEHSALYQALRSGRLAEVRRLIITASGGGDEYIGVGG